MSNCLSIRSFYSMILGFVFCLANSFCFAYDDLSTSQLNAPNLSPYETGRGPGFNGQNSNNQLSFTFDASEQPTATGTFIAYVTLPNQTQYSFNGEIGTGSNPAVLELGPPSLLGTYTLTLVISSLSGTMNPDYGPYLIAKNLTNGTTLSTTFNVTTQGSQDTKTFVNSSP